MRSRLHPFRPRLLDAVKGYDRRRFGADVGAGLTVGVVALLWRWLLPSPRA